MSPAPRRQRLDEGPCERVAVTTHARLHFGFFDPSGRSPEPFGSIGLYLDRPTTRLSLERSDAAAAIGPDGERAIGYLQELAARYERSGPYRLVVQETIPAHAGLGSGTQLALSVGAAFARIEDLRLSAREIAAVLKRGRRSGIGAGSFDLGGLLLDGGPVGGRVPEILARTDFPDRWRVLLIFDEAAEGLHGSKEIEAFTHAPAVSEAMRAELRARAENGAMEAAKTGDFERFSAEIGHLQAVMGAYFAPFQGGPIISRSVAAAIDWLRFCGLTGVGQSSWGPTGFAFVPDLTTGKKLAEAARRRPDLEALRFELAQGLNHGASIEAG